MDIMAEKTARAMLLFSSNLSISQHIRTKQYNDFWLAQRELTGCNGTPSKEWLLKIAFGTILEANIHQTKHIHNHAPAFLSRFFGFVAFRRGVICR
jgi:hypothetical protein